MRSLKAKVPFQSAMDRLVGLFEDASRKVSVTVMDVYMYLII
jgi:hypothetical protein